MDIHTYNSHLLVNAQILYYLVIIYSTVYTLIITLTDA